MTRFKRFLAVMGVLAATCLGGTAVAQYPERPLRLVVPYAAGGPADVVARELAQKLSADLEGVGNYGLQPVGSLNSQYKVFVSRYVADNEIILGRKGSGFLDAGVVYAPYIPLFVSDRFFDVKLQKTTQSYASRFGIFTIANTVYGRVLIDDAQEGIVLPS